MDFIRSYSYTILIKLLFNDKFFSLRSLITDWTWLIWVRVSWWEFWYSLLIFLWSSAFWSIYCWICANFSAKLCLRVWSLFTFALNYNSICLILLSWLSMLCYRFWIVELTFVSRSWNSISSCWRWSFEILVTLSSVNFLSDLKRSSIKTKISCFNLSLAKASVRFS